jgi:1,4-alpha-glucan branching enzyme
MPGDAWQQFANLRLLYGYMWAHPGKKLLFMGCEFGQRREWTHEGALEWQVLDQPGHAGVLRWIADLNALYRREPALHEVDFDAAGFEWVDSHDAEASVLSFLRRPRQGPPVLAVCNFTPVPRENYIVGVPEGGFWRELLNSDAADYGGSGIGNLGGVDAAPVPAQGRTHSLALTLPPLATILLKPERRP